MKRHGILKVVSGQEPGAEERDSRGTNVGGGGSLSTIERGILTTLGDMERLVEEALHRPFFGNNLLRFRTLGGENGLKGIHLPVDIVETDSELVVTTELPGVKREDISVKVQNGILTIAGEKRLDESSHHGDYLRRELFHGTFNRSLPIGEGFSTEKISARFTDGVLEIRIPRIAERQAARKIVVH